MISWTSMIVGYAQNGLAEEVENVITKSLKEIQSRGMQCL